MHSTILSACFLYTFLVFTAFAQGPPGACLRGQNDAGFTYQPSDYVPVVYEFTSSSPKAVKTGQPLKFFSYNIQSGYEFNCAQILPTQIAFEAEQNADFYALQETDIDVDIRCGCNMPQLVANGVGYKSYFMQMFPWRTGKYGHFTAFGYPAEYTTYLYYTVVPTFERRGALAHLVSPPQLNGYKMWFVNTHMEQSSFDVRQGQVTELKAWVQNTLLAREPNAIVIMAGDYYTVPGDGSYESMRQYFGNVWETYHGSTEGGFTHLSNVATQRFDHFWYKEPASGNIKIEINNFEIPQNLYSDHLAIVAEITFTTSGTAPTVSSSGSSAATSGSSAATSGSSAATSGSTASSGSSAATSGSTASSSSADSSGATSSAPTVSSSSSSSAASSSSSATSGTVTSTSGGPTRAPNNCGFEVNLQRINAWNSSTAAYIQYRMTGRNTTPRPLPSFRFRLTLTELTSTLPAAYRWNFVQDTPLANGVATGHASLWGLPGMTIGGDTGFVVQTPLPYIGRATAEVIC